MASGDYAGFWIRFFAAFIDGIIISIVVLPIMFFLTFGLATGGGDGLGAAGGIINLISIVIPWLYYAFMESSEGQATVGKRLLGIRVTDTNGDRISFLRATGRYFAKYVSAVILMIGYIIAAFTERKQALHDMIAGTLVVRG